MITIIEQPRPLTSNGIIELGDTFTDPAMRNLFSRHENTMAVGNRSFSDVVLDPHTTIVFQDRTAVYGGGGYRRHGDLEAATRRLEGLPDHRLRERRVFMGVCSFDNYYHWMTESIPAIASYQMDPNFADGVLLINNRRAVTDNMWQAIRLATCNRNIPNCVMIGETQMSIQELVCSSLLLPQKAPSQFANDLFDRMADQIGRSNGLPNRRLYVSRADTARNPIINEDALIALMLRYDIEPVIPGQLSQTDQISAFRDASLVVGAHGAGLTNIAFMQPRALVYEIFPSCMVIPCFNNLCQGRGIHYFADVFSCPPPVNSTLENYRSTPWQIDLAVVERRLVALDKNSDQR